VLEEETAKFDPKADLFSQYLHNTVEELVGKPLRFVRVHIYRRLVPGKYGVGFPDADCLLRRGRAIVGFHVKTVDTRI
jgi:hypothetical protein